MQTRLRTIKATPTHKLEIHDWSNPLSRLEDGWREQGLCWNTDLDFFTHDLQEQQELKSLCRGCPVRSKCLDTAIEDKLLSGIWGGVLFNTRSKTVRARIAEARREMLL